MIFIKKLWSLPSNILVNLYLASCGHYIVKRKDQAHIKNCRQCKFDQLCLEASRMNLLLLNQIDKNTAFYKCKITGKITVRRMTRVRDKVKLRQTEYKDSGIVYLIKIQHQQHSWLKLGVTNRTQKSRYKQYGLPKESVIESIGFYITMNSKEAFALETKISNEIRSYKINCDMMKNGYTECYSVEYQSIVTNIFERICNEHQYNFSENWK